MCGARVGVIDRGGDVERFRHFAITSVAVVCLCRKRRRSETAAGRTIIVGPLTRSRPVTRSNELIVDVARIPAAPFCEPRKPSGPTQTSYRRSRRRTCPKFCSRHVGGALYSSTLRRPQSAQFVVADGSCEIHARPGQAKGSSAQPTPRMTVSAPIPQQSIREQ